MAKGTVSITYEKMEQVLLELKAMDKQYTTLSDRELAHILEADMLKRTQVLSLEYVLWSQVIWRLLRSAGGPGVVVPPEGSTASSEAEIEHES